MVAIGLNMTLPREPEPNPFITPELAFLFRYFALRKMHFLLCGKALVTFFGCYGTLVQLFEVLTLMQIERMLHQPIFLGGTDSCHQTIDFEYLVDEGFISAQDVQSFTRLDTTEEIVPIFQAFNSGKQPVNSATLEWPCTHATRLICRRNY